MASQTYRKMPPEITCERYFSYRSMSFSRSRQSTFTVRSAQSRQ